MSDHGLLVLGEGRLRHLGAQVAQVLVDRVPWAHSSSVEPLSSTRARRGSGSAGTRTAAWKRVLDGCRVDVVPCDRYSSGTPRMAACGDALRVGETANVRARPVPCWTTSHLDTVVVAQDMRTLTKPRPTGA
jgi:hypothetical protein